MSNTSDPKRNPMTPQNFWRRLYPKLLEGMEDNITWDNIIDALTRRHVDLLKCFRMIEKENELLNAQNCYEYRPGIGQLTYLCPVCGDTYMHIQSVASLSCGDESGDAPIDGIESATLEEPTEWRRPAVVIEIEGEACKHRFRLRLQQHKGQIFIFTETMTWQPTTVRSSSAAIAPEARAILEAVDTTAEAQP